MTRWRAPKPADDNWPEAALTLASHHVRSAVVEYLYEEFGLTHDAWPRDSRFDRIAFENMTSRNAVRVLRMFERTIEIEYALLVAQARLEGTSWAEIGRLLNITKQAAQQRFGPVAARIAEIFGRSEEEVVFERIFLKPPEEQDQRVRRLVALLTDHYGDTKFGGWAFDWPRSDHLDTPAVEGPEPFDGEPPF